MQIKLNNVNEQLTPIIGTLLITGEECLPKIRILNFVKTGFVTRDAESDFRARARACSSRSIMAELGERVHVV